MDTKEVVHPADAFGKRKPTYPPNPLSNILKAVDAELSKPTPPAVGRYQDEDGSPLFRADSRIEEIARLIITLPFGDMLNMGKEISTTPMPDHSATEGLPADIQLAMRLNTWAQKKMEERCGLIRETPTTK